MYGRVGLSIGSANRPSHQPLAWAIVRSHHIVAHLLTPNSKVLVFTLTPVAGLNLLQENVSRFSELSSEFEF